MSAFHGDLGSLAFASDAKTFSVCAENPEGRTGAGGMAESGTGASCARELGRGWKVNPYYIIEPGEVKILADVEGPGMINHIWLTEGAQVNRGFVIRMYWDGSESPSVECPLGDFFAHAFETKHAQINSLAVCCNPMKGFNCYWQMPFAKRALITIENLTPQAQPVFFQIDGVKCALPDGALYFHAQFRRSNVLKYMDVHTLLDGVEGKGQYVGTYMFWGVHNNGWWGEGEIKFYLDGDEWPTVCGTGTEDYFCGSYNFDVGGQYREFSSPYSGMPMVIRPDGAYSSQQRFSLYRWHICDPIYFERDLKVTIQALGWRSEGRYLPLQDDISSVAYWYQTLPCTKFPPLPDKNALEII
ncbi:MAG TPA: DUF2961 domain-containing protein [Bacillota bacterium]|nr:DUF2961 domain-containing protein [Bacillota bacterium]